MAGHSKFANIKHRKAAQDKKRGKVFTKIIRELTVAAKGGGDPACNPALRLAMDKAMAANMTKDTMERAIKRGSGEDDDTEYFELRYEGYGPGGAAVMVDCMTDNKNRTASDVRHAFTKNGGNLGQDGSVAFLFDRVGLLVYPAGSNEDRIIEVALEAGAEDVTSNEDESIEVITGFKDFLDVKEAMIRSGMIPDHSEIVEKPTTSTEVTLDDAEKMLHLIDTLEDLDDVQEVHTNAEFSADILDQLAAE